MSEFENNEISCENNVIGCENNVIEDKNENVEMQVKKKVEFNENVDEKIIENNSDKKREVKKELLLSLKKLIDVSVSRGVYKPSEIGNIGKAYNELKEEITEEEVSEISVTNLNNVKILTEISISRGGFMPSELSDVGGLYDILLNLLNN